jgi:beta-fructofuranosidase
MKFIIQISFLISICLGELLYEPDFDETLNNSNWITSYPKLNLTKGNETINKPFFHFAPSSGWMNDPNGCFKNPKTGEWNLYYQYCGLKNIWCSPMFWGHAVSYDMNTWVEKPLAIGPPDHVSGVFSGSIFIDEENKSEFFPKDNEYPNVIAAWTYNYDKDGKHYQNQWISYSKDGGLTFITIPEGTKVNDEVINPNIESYKDNEQSSELSAEFRDPQVIKYKGNLSDGTSEELFIMTVAKTQEYRINFYSSTTGRKFYPEGNFQFGGYLGHQYECPNLVHLKNLDKEDYPNEADSYWILFISINPGSLHGGSSTEYLIGQFGRQDNDKNNKLTFTLSYPYPVQLDMGKDFYALQLFYETPTETELDEGYKEIRGIAWTSNWQYSNFVPTDTWRSSMSIPRKLSLGHQNINYVTKVLYLNQEPVLEHDFFKELEKVNVTKLEEFEADKTVNIYDAKGEAFGALEFFIDWEFEKWGNPNKFTLYFRGGSIPDEYLKIGFYNDHVFFDRGHTNVQWVKESPGFTEKFTMLTQRIGGYENFSIYGIIDRNICELFTNVVGINDRRSFMTMTNTFFFTGGNYINSIDLLQTDGTKIKGTLRVRQIFPDDLPYTTKSSDSSTDEPTTDL